MEQPHHNQFWGPLVRKRLGDELPARADQVRDLLDHPGWEILAGLIDEAKRREVDRLVSSQVLSQGEYIGVTRIAFAFDVCRQLPHVVLFEAQRELERRQREANAASRREEA